MRKEAGERTRSQEESLACEGGQGEILDCIMRVVAAECLMPFSTVERKEKKSSLPPPER